METICGSIGSMSFNVWSARKRIEKLKCIATRWCADLSPVLKRKWSSYRFYLSGEEGTVRINEGWTEIRLPFRCQVYLPHIQKRDVWSTQVLFVSHTQTKPRKRGVRATLANPAYVLSFALESRHLLRETDSSE
jgi:hypothetical protein